MKKCFCFLILLGGCMNDPVVGLNLSAETPDEVCTSLIMELTNLMLDTEDPQCQNKYNQTLKKCGDMCMALSSTVDKEKKVEKNRINCISAMGKVYPMCGVVTVEDIFRLHGIEGDFSYVKGKSCSEIFDYYVNRISSLETPSFCESLASQTAALCRDFFCPVLDNSPEIDYSLEQYLDCGNSWQELDEQCDVKEIMQEHLVPKCGDGVVADGYGEECEATTNPLSCDSYFSEYPDVFVPGLMKCSADCLWVQDTCVNPSCNDGTFNGDPNPYPEFEPEVCDSKEIIDCGFFPGYYRDLNNTENVPCKQDCSGWEDPDSHCTKRPKKTILWRFKGWKNGILTIGISSKIRRLFYLQRIRQWSTGSYYGINWYKESVFTEPAVIEIETGCASDTNPCREGYVCRHDSICYGARVDYGVGNYNISRALYGQDLSDLWSHVLAEEYCTPCDGNKVVEVDLSLFGDNSPRGIIREVSNDYSGGTVVLPDWILNQESSVSESAESTSDSWDCLINPELCY